MRILIFEPNISGHRINYLKIVLQALEEKKHQLTLLTLDSLRESSALEFLNTELVSNLEIKYAKLNRWTYKIYAGHKLYNRELINFLVVRNYIKRTKRHINYDLIFFPYLDNLARLLSLSINPFFGISFCGISMVPSFHYRKMGIKIPKPYFPYLKEKLFIRLLKNQYTKQILTIDRPMHEYILHSYPHLRECINYASDPVIFYGQGDKLSSRSYFQIPQHKKVILLYGSVSERKGVLELLKASDHKNFPKDAVIVVAGVQTNKVKEKINALQFSNGKAFFFDKYLSSEEEYMIFKSADLVWCGYKEFYGMSAVLIQAGAMGLPVISSDEGIVSWVTKKYQTGKVVNIQIEEQIIEAIQLLLEDEVTYRKCSENGNTLASTHTVQSFKEKIIEAVSLN